MKRVEKTEGGHSNTLAIEPLGEMFRLPGELWMVSKNNSQIRLGRDRSGPPHSGKGGLNQGQCGAIDLFVGAGPKNRGEAIAAGQSPGDSTGDFYINPNMPHDASRVYITERGDIDDYFKIQTSEHEMHGVARNRAAVGIKSDHVRIFATTHMKLVTGLPDSAGDVTNGLGGRVDGGGRIEFITGNNVENRSGGQAALQPVPLGDNLENLLVEILDIITSLTTLTINNTTYIQEVGSSLVKHIHPNTPQPIPGTALISPTAMIEVAPTLAKSMAQNTVGGELQKANIRVANLNYLNPYAPEYILSAGVYTT
tara:strand:- start:679 stop:1611 length:933 start_codon:yes stop_codon:yes gene_type:complete